MTITNFQRKAAALLVAACFAGAQAAPTVPQVVSGQASFAQQGNVFSITNTPNTILNWQSFSVNPGEITRFIQQSSDSAVLNRIVGQDPSRILGALQSNGRVFLINPNGIVFGAGAQVDVNGLTASTLNLANADFLAGKNRFSATPGAGAISNQGAITTPGGGQVFLIAPNVANSGIIRAPDGAIVLAAGHSVQLVDSANPDLHVVVSSPADQAINLGQVVAQGGRIGIYGALVAQRGLVSANSAQVGANGKIVLKASADTVLEAGSVTSATGAGKGGEIHVLGQRVGLTGDAKVDASGAQGGGSVLVGGAWQGANPLLPNARQSWLGKDASIKADATVSGAGGTVVLWSDGATRAFGSISARGGAAGGDGGRVETSGHFLDVTGARVDTGAAAGKRGGWLLDPYDIDVVNLHNAVTLDDVALFTNGQVEGVTQLDVALLAGATSNVTLQAQHDLTFSTALTTRTGVKLTGQAGNNINVNAPITSGGDLEFIAGNTFTTGAAALISSANRVDITANDVVFGGAIIGNGALPMVSFGTATPSRDITIAPMAYGESLALAPGELARIKASEIRLGNFAHTGNIRVDTPFVAGAGDLARLVFETGGSVMINAAIDLSANPGASFTATRTGDAPGSVTVGSTGSINAGSVNLRADDIAIMGTIAAANSVTLAPHHSTAGIDIGTYGESYGGGRLVLGADELSRISTNDLTIGGQPGQTGGLEVAGLVDLTMSLGAKGTLTLDAGDGPLMLTQALTTPGVLALKSSGAIAQAQPFKAGMLVVKGGSVSLTSANQVGLVAGSAGSGAFDLAADGDVTVGIVGGLFGINGPAGVSLAATGKVFVANDVNAGSGAIEIAANGISGGGTLRAADVHLFSQAGIGDGAPLRTQTAYLSAINSVSEGAAPINIQNTGNLTLGSVVQDGANNLGAITIDNIGDMTVPQYEPANFAETSTMAVAIRANSGAIKLLAHGPLAVNGIVSTTSGDIALNAGNGGALTVGATGLLSSATGNVDLMGGSVKVDGMIVTAGQVHQPGVIDPPPLPPVPPTVAACLVTPQLNGCATVLANAVPACLANSKGADCSGVLQQAMSACIADPAGANCSAVLPTFEACLSAPSSPGCVVRLPTTAACEANLAAPGCTVVLPSLMACAANPATPGCGAVNSCVATPSAKGCSAFLPQLSSCIVNPAAPGCGAVLPTLSACTSAPTAPGCSVVLPTLKVCTATPTAAGCSVVLPTLSACTSAPTAPGCSVVLPTLSLCTATPTAPGCSVVLPTLSMCTATPTAAGCSVILPTLSMCTATPTAAGCSVVLPSLSMCTATPTAAGCSVVLPTLSICTATPTAPGCGVVLPTLSMCTATPTAPGCSVVLPTLSICTATPTAPGCSVVLPALSSCIATPAAAGCAVVLPTLPACLTTPTAKGCSVVLPTLSVCTATPTAAGCSVVLPSLSACVASPTAPGCGVVLPPLSACVASPTAPGCAVVLPTLASCVGSPAAAGCSVVLPTLSACVASPTAPGCAVVLPSLSQCTAAPTLGGCQAVLPTLAQCAAAPSTAGCAAVLPTAAVCATQADSNPACASLAPSSAPAADGAREPLSKALANAIALANDVPASALPDTATSSKKKDSADKDASSTTIKTGVDYGKPAKPKTYCN